MATSGDFLSEDQFQCSICLDIFTDPVSTPCGHTFCKACLTRHWAGKRECQCPLCNNKFDKDLKLSVNTTFREVVDNFKKHHPTADATSLLKPWEVSCDVCAANKLRASKTCLVCLASFCETHLEPHLRVTALRRHKLSNPVSNLEEKICREHNRIVEFFCLNDHISLCALCTEHSDHDTVSLNEAYIDQRSHIWRRKENIGQTKHKGKAQSKKKGKSGRAEKVKANQTTDGNCLPYHRNIPSHFNPFDSQNKDFSMVKEMHGFEVSGMVGWDLVAIRESDFVRIAGTRSQDANWDRHCILRFQVQRNTQRLMLLIDYSNGLVLLFDPDNKILLHRFTGCGIHESIFPFFIRSQPDFVTSLQSLRRRAESISGHLDISHWCLRFFIITMTSIWILHSLLIGAD
ncbi:probable E3 ubiquitin-protein ligase TRIM8 [Xiphophorus maculatus]|nr:probable E3 ubiquitin-protein ligase TRIM8 [Xiphophorus maculatus]XP_023186184.1 probable E3 ubiquitin-protein ligase TRIM8 [Xiphophorus maculatus]